MNCDACGNGGGLRKIGEISVEEHKGRTSRRGRRVPDGREELAFSSALVATGEEGGKGKK